MMCVSIYRALPNASLTNKTCERDGRDHDLDDGLTRPHLPCWVRSLSADRRPPRVCVGRSTCMLTALRFVPWTHGMMLRARDRFAEEVCRADAPFAAELFFSLLSVIVSYDPVGWGVPYGGSFTSDIPARQLEMSAQVRTGGSSASPWKLIRKGLVSECLCCRSHGISVLFLFVRAPRLLRAPLAHCTYSCDESTCGLGHPLVSPTIHLRRVRLLGM